MGVPKIVNVVNLLIVVVVIVGVVVDSAKGEGESRFHSNLFCIFFVFWTRSYKQNSA